MLRNSSMFTSSFLLKPHCGISSIFALGSRQKTRRCCSRSSFDICVHAHAHAHICCMFNNKALESSTLTDHTLTGLLFITSQKSRGEQWVILNCPLAPFSLNVQIVQVTERGILVLNIYSRFTGQYSCSDSKQWVRKRTMVAGE